MTHVEQVEHAPLKILMTILVQENTSVSFD